MRATSWLLDSRPDLCPHAAQTQEGASPGTRAYGVAGPRAMLIPTLPVRQGQSGGSTGTLASPWSSLSTGSSRGTLCSGCSMAPQNAGARTSRMFHAT